MRGGGVRPRWTLRALAMPDTLREVAGCAVGADGAATVVGVGAGLTRTALLGVIRVLVPKLTHRAQLAH